MLTGICTCKQAFLAPSTHFTASAKLSILSPTGIFTIAFFTDDAIVLYITSFSLEFINAGSSNDVTPDRSSFSAIESFSLNVRERSKLLIAFNVMSETTNFFIFYIS